MDEPWPRPCSNCGVPYDGRLRGLAGRFHMAVKYMRVEGNSALLTGHWREGIAPAKGEFVLTVSGREEHFRAAPVPPPSAAASERGQLVMRVLGGYMPTTVEGGCVWGESE